MAHYKSAFASLSHIFGRQSLRAFVDLWPDLVGKYMSNKSRLKFEGGNGGFFSIEFINLLLSLVGDEIILIFPVDMGPLPLMLYKRLQETIIHTEPVHNLSTKSRQLCSHSTQCNQQVRNFKLLELSINQTSVLTCNTLSHLQYICPIHLLPSYTSFTTLQRLIIHPINYPIIKVPLTLHRMKSIKKLTTSCKASSLPYSTTFTQ